MKKQEYLTKNRDRTPTTSVIWEVWYNEKFKDIASLSEVEWCWENLLKINPSEVDLALSNPKDYFNDSDFSTLGAENLVSVRKEWKRRLSILSQN